MGQPSSDYNPTWMNRRQDLQMIQQSVPSFQIEDKLTEDEYVELQSAMKETIIKQLDKEVSQSPMLVGLILGFAVFGVVWYRWLRPKAVKK